MILKSLNRKKIQKLSLYDIAKIIIISMVGFYLIGGYSAYFESGRADAYLYAVTTIDLFKGSFGFTNHLLEETGNWDFVPYMWTKTIHNTAIPIGDVGIYGFTSFFYLVGGLYGLFYLGPILTIIFFIIAERVATNLFGKFVGLLTLVFLASDFILLWIGIQLRNDNIFTIFFMLGCFYLIKFFKDKKDTSILLCSIFFVIGTFIRLNGIIALPLEILLVLGYFGFNIYFKNKHEIKHSQIFLKNVFLKIKLKDVLKKSLLLLIPWIIFLGFYMSFNQYYYGDPFTDYFDERPRTINFETDSKTSFFKFDSWRFTWLNFYSVGFLPDIIKDFLFDLIPTIHDNLGGNPVGILSFLILLFTVIISIYFRKKRKEVIVLSVFILGIILFYSSGFLHATNLNSENFQPTLFSRDRYMIPALPLYFIIFSVFIYQIWDIFIKSRLNNKSKKFYKSSRNGLMITASIFIIITLFYSTPFQKAWNEGIKVKDPSWDILRFPLDSEGFSENDSIILEGRRYAYEYDAIHFFPYWGYWDKLRYEFDKTSLPQDPIRHLKELMNEGYNIYVFKDQYRSSIDTKYFKFLEEQHGFILSTHSQLFCKLEKIDNDMFQSNNLKSDPDCHPTYNVDDNEEGDYNNVVLSISIPVRFNEETGELLRPSFSLAPPLKNYFR